MKHISYLDCPHKNVQQFTEYCLDCGYSIHTTEKEYLADLRRKTGHLQHEAEIRKLERKLNKRT